MPPGDGGVERRIGEDKRHEDAGSVQSRKTAISEVLNAAGVMKQNQIELRSHPRPVERATTRDADGKGGNMLHGVNDIGG